MITIIRVLSVLFSPIIVFITLFEHIKEKNNKVDWSLLVAPETRSEMVMQQIGGVCVIIAYVLFYFMKKTGAISIEMMLYVILIPTLVVAFSFMRMLQNQSKAKEKWLETFDYIMQKAVINNDNDLYNTAYNHYNTVKAFPAAPLTEIAKTYLAINAVIQVIINFIFSLYK